MPLYRQDELLNWIEQGRHLTRVKQDRCQLTQDIEARASVMKIPAYQFLWGDMLAWGVCTKPDAQVGVQYMWEAANQGLAPALEQLGRYYWKGILVQKDLVRAETLMREAASLGFLRAQMEWVEMLLQGMGSPLDYEEAYHWLHGAVIGDNCLIGMGATLLDNARIPSGCIIAANALVLSNAQLEPNSVYAGVPAKKVKEVTPEQREEIIRRTAHDYMLYASWFKEDE